MKPNILLVAFTAVVVTGCALFKDNQAPPSTLEKALYDIKTNVVPVTNVVTLTNTVQRVETITQMVYQTNPVTQVIEKTNFSLVTVTNQVPELSQLTNIGLLTNYKFTPKDSVTATVGAAGAVTAPWGGIIGSTVITGLLGLWGTLRSRGQANTLQTVSETSQQAIAVAQQLIASLPNGAQLTMAYQNWLAAHHAESGVASEIATIIDETVDSTGATHAAQDILKAATTPPGTMKA